MIAVHKIKMDANVLPTVVVVAVLMMLTVLAVMAIWEMDTQVFIRNNHIKARRGDVSSAFIIYEENPEIYSKESFAIFEDEPLSEITLRRKPWGLYEVLTVSSVHGKICESAIIGLRPDAKKGLYYADNNSSLTLTGNTNIQGVLYSPRNGIIYGQMKSVFFNGERISQNRIKTSEKYIPRPESEIKDEVKKILELPSITEIQAAPDKLSVSFHDDSTAIFSLADGLANYYDLSGNIVLAGDKIRIGSSNTFNDIIVAARSVTLEKGFRGTLQVIARDSLIVEENVCLEYSSGLYSENYMELGKGSVINGYAVVRAKDTDIRKPNYKQSRLSKVRGLLYIDGNAQLQGIVSGSVYLSRAVYYSAEGYYKDILYDVSILDNEEMSTPLWLCSDGKRKKIKSVR